MTICLAAICDANKTIVSVSDMKISTGEFSADATSRKVEIIDNNWVVMFSGNDISPFVPIVNPVFNAISGQQVTLDLMTSEFVKSYQRYVVNRITSEVLSPYDLTMKEFREDGLAQFGEPIFTDFTRKLDEAKARIDIMFLVFGFDYEGHPHIFTVSSPGVYSCYDTPGFCAVGSGANVALGMMFFQNFAIVESCGDAIYKGCVSKFMAESGSDIGLTTFVTVSKFKC
jgi:20S proteasome alpha/beta subunit